MMIKQPERFLRPNKIILIISLLYISLALFFVFVLDHNFMVSDVSSYWQASIQWRTPFREHPPFYAFTIAFFRLISLNLIPPVLLMMIINLISLIGCVYCLIQISKNAGLNLKLSALIVFLFTLWPFVGLTYTVVPLADIPAIALTLGGILLLQVKKPYLAAVLFGLAIVTHKGVWPIIGLIAISVYVRQKLVSKEKIIFTIITLAPVAALWIMGAFYHGSLNWFMERSLRVNTTFGEGLMILDGLFGTFREGGFNNLLKGLIVLFLIGLAIIAFIYSLRKKDGKFKISTAISLAVLLLFVFSSQDTIWGPVRFSRFLIVPFIFIIRDHFEGIFSLRATKLVVSSLIVVLLLTQFAYAWYIARVFFG